MFIDGMDVDVLTKELGARETRFWEVAEPREVAESVFGDPLYLADLDDLPAAGALVDQMRAGDADDPIRSIAYGLIGLLIRAAVPHAAQTAGRHWVVTLKELIDLRRLRLTVGASEVAILVWAPTDDIDLYLRIAASPIQEALADGSLDAATMAQFGISTRPDPVTTFANDAVRYHCPGAAAAEWFLDQPAVMIAARLMNARLCADGALPVANLYDPALTAETWAAAEPLVAPTDEPVAPAAARPTTVDHGYDQPYAGLPAGPEAQRAAAIERDVLICRLIEHLGRHGVESGVLNTPPVDLAWVSPRGTQMIAEVRSCAADDDTEQLRSGLGELLDHRQRLLPKRRAVAAFLLVSRVVDPTWYDICVQAGIRLLSGDDEDGWNLAGL
jgi:hypothetical protein